MRVVGEEEGRPMKCQNCLSGDRPVCAECGRLWLGSFPEGTGSSLVAVDRAALEELVEAEARSAYYVGSTERLEKALQPFRGESKP